MSGTPLLQKASTSTSSSSSSEEDDSIPAIPSSSRYATEETSPLLGRDSPSDPRDLYRQNVIILIIVFIFLIELGQGMLVAPSSALMENIICKEYHPEVSDNFWANDPVCKQPDVQGTLALIRGWMMTFDCIPGILGSVPYGIMSDKVGRKPVLILGIGGYWLSFIWIVVVLYFSNFFALWTVWFGSAFMLIGGSTSVVAAMLYTMGADVVPVAERATLFLQVNSIFLLAEMISGPLSGVLLHKDPWLATMAALGVTTVGFLVCFLFPETLEIQRLHDRQNAATIHPHSAANGNSTISSAEPQQPQQPFRLSNLWTTARHELLEVWNFILKNRRIAFLMLSLVFVVLGRYVQEYLLQYATKRYGWTWDRAAVLLTIRSGSTLLLLAVILPAISWMCVNTFHMPAVTKDLLLARVSGVVQTLGATSVAFSVTGQMLCFSLVVLAAGGGMPALIRSLANALVEEHHIGIMNSFVGFMEMVGVIIGGPLLAWTLKIGFARDGWWVGLPFMCAAVLSGVCTLIVFAFRIPKGYSGRVNGLANGNGHAHV